MNETTTNGRGELVEQYFVVKNHEEQFSIWPAWRDVPLGWETVGDKRPREDCLDWIEENWVDMRPASLRKFIEASGATGEVNENSDVK